MEYKNRLRRFNSTEKYFKEVAFLRAILSNPNENPLDFGCGLGTAMDELSAVGYDINNYYEGHNRDVYHLGILPEGSFSDIYFMHSFAHINNPVDVLKTIKEKYPNAAITVITPNKDWLVKNHNEEYVPDPTVFRHYYQMELENIFVECGYKVILAGQFGEHKNGYNERIFIQAK